MTDPTCRRCDAPMQPGIALESTVRAGTPDLGGGIGQTMTIGGPGVVVPVSKCSTCGWSVTADPVGKEESDG